MSEQQQATTGVADSEMPATSPTIDIEDININEEQEDEEEKPSTSDISDKDDDHETAEATLKEYLPWLIAAGMGFLLLIIAVVLLVTAGSAPFVFPYKSQHFNVPNFQGSMRVFSVAGQELKYTSDLRFIGSQVSRSLRYKIEPKLKNIYSNASLPVDSVVVLSFKYGGAGETSVAQEGKTILGRSGDSVDQNAIVVQHWVYLVENVTDSVENIKEKVVAAIDKVDGIKIDKNSISLKSLENMTRDEAIKALTQAGFFKNGLAGLDFGLLDTFGLSPMLGLQSEDDEGLCRSLRAPRHGRVLPKMCTASINTYVQMACEFSCDAEYELVGSRKRVCLSSGLWSGEPVQCQRTCSPLQLLSVGGIQPLACGLENISAGQMCFLECPSTMYRMAFPTDLSVLRRVPERDLWPSLYYEAMMSDKVEPYSDVRGYFRECGTDGLWMGSDASCKALCPKIRLLLHSSVTPQHCQVDPLEGEQCIITCDSGYGIVGGGTSQILMCDVRGKWTDELKACQKLCPKIEEDLYMNVAPKVCLSSPHEGIKCEYECDAGYFLSGNPSRACVEGSWDNPQPTCLRTCGALIHPQNGMMMSDAGLCSGKPVMEGTNCDLFCDPGYVSSVTSTTCQSSGDWSIAQSALICRSACPPLDLEEYGSWSPASCHVAHYSLLGSCILTCGGGYTLEGSSTLTCSTGGDWSNQPGKCVVHCQGLSSPGNGELESKASCGDGSATINTTCEFSCDAGYRIDGDRILKCSSDGSWSSSPPICQAESQYLIAQTWDDHFICLVVDVDGQVEKIDQHSQMCYTENGRWSITGNHIQNVLTRMCLTANQTSTLLHMEDCDLTNANQDFESGFGLTLKLIGEEKYVTSGYRTIRRPQLGSFVSSFAHKHLLWKFFYAVSGLSGAGSSLFSLQNGGNCKPLAISSSVSVTPLGCIASSQTPSTTCSLSCTDADLSIPGQSTTTCSDGRWNIDPDIHCVARTPTQCVAIPADIDSNIIMEPNDCTAGNSNPGGECIIKCVNSTDQYLDGPSRVECLKSGRWTPQTTPVCKPRCKSLLPLPENSYLITGNALDCSGFNGLPVPGSVCAMSCLSGFELVGESILTCTNNGEWSSPLPECMAVCLDLQDIPHGYLTNCTSQKLPTGYLAGTMCDIACENGFQPGLSMPTITCQSSGSWIVHVIGSMDCLTTCPVFAPLPLLQLSTDCTIGTLTVGHECTFYCEDGYGLEFSISNDKSVNFYTRTCMDDGNWSGSIVKCSRRCDPLPEIGETNSGYYSPSACQSDSHRPGMICALLCQGDDAVYGGPNMLTCGEDGEWKPAGGFGMCSSACGALPKSPHISITPQSCTEGFVKKETKCVLTCPGYMERIGSGYRKCLGVPDSVTGSLWSGSAGQTVCVSRCPPLAPTIGVFVFPSDCAFRSKIKGDICSFECSSGYSLLGKTVLRCTSSGTWHDALPSCYKPCPPMSVSNGQLSCNEAHGFLSEGFGYAFRPGTRCYYSCDSGFTVYEQNEVTCDQDGVWSPAPFCSPISDAFPIIQKIGDESVCLQASQLGSDGSSEGSEWHLTVTQNSSQGCEAAGNNAMWTWFDSLNLKHAETGLCLTAESGLTDASLLLQLCDVTNKLQHWSCDAQHPYRFVLKDTDLSIDSVYKELGPVLQRWTHAETYWITFNPVLEAAGTVCSNKPVGACPAIKKSFMKIIPEVCTTDEIRIWQRCAVSCEEGSLFDGSTDIVECKPTGEWENLDQLFCRRNCPALPTVDKGYYDAVSCDQGDNIHQTICNMSCHSGYILSNDQVSSSFACDDGEWIGEIGLSCQNRCKYPPVAPSNGRVDCISKICRVVCNMGHRIQGNSSQFNCMDGLDYVSINNITCVAEYHFRLQLRTTVFSVYTETCISAIVVRGQPKVAKLPCDVGNTFQYWRWEDSFDVLDTDFSMLRNAGTGLCLAATSDESWVELTVKLCNESNSLQQWTCNDYLHPGRFGLVSNSSSYVDVGSILPFAPPVLRKDDFHLDSSEWIAADMYGNIRYTCVSRTVGACPKLFVGPYTIVEPQGCVSWDGLPIGAECRISCEDGYELASGEEHRTLKCQTSGGWDENLQRCVAKSVATGTCSSLTVGARIIVTPEKCASNNGQALLVGEVCKFSCESGYLMNGAEEVICKEGDLWTDEVPECVAFCPGISPQQGMELDSEKCFGVVVLESTTCNMTCAEGFLPGPDLPPFIETKCQSNGLWSDSALFCEATCPPLSEPPYNATSESDDFQDPTSFRQSLTSASCASSRSLPRTTCTFSCTAGNVSVEGANEVVCNLEGRWNGRPPRCVEEYYCPKVSETNLKAFYGALLDEVAVYPGTIVRIKCDEGYIPDGNDIRICQTDGLWNGNGPEIPACVKKCKPLVPPFATEIIPYQCSTGYVEEGLICTYICLEGTEMEGQVTSKEVTCSDGKWLDEPPKCFVKNPANMENLNVHTPEGGFLIITREPERGCLYAGEDKVVRWRPANECDPRQVTNRWEWYDSQRLMNFQGNLCMQALNSTQANTTLVVGHCANGISFGCGDPKSVFHKYFLFSTSLSRWRLGFVSDADTGTPMQILMVKADLENADLQQDIFEGLNIYGNIDIMNPRTTDKSVCSYMCGGTIQFENNYQSSVIASPGFIYNQQYPPNSHCEWILYGHGKIVTIELQEIDLESSDGNDCSTDCVNIYSGDSEGSAFSDHLASYYGNDISKQKSQMIKSVSSSLHISFWSNGANQGRGFAIKYKFEDAAESRTHCGVREKSDDQNTDEGPGLRGALTTIEKWPWLASIREKYRGSSKAYHRCTGAIIANDMVVTAAHCARFTKRSSLSSVDIGIGFTLQNDMNENMRRSGYLSTEPIFQIYHGYDYISRNGDIALWKLIRPVVQSGSVFPICLAQQGYRVYEPKAKCYGAGWSSLMQGITLNQILEYEVTMSSSFRCKETLGLNTETAFACAENFNFDISGLRETTSSEPLMCEFNGNWYLAGVRSYTHIGTRSVLRLYTDLHAMTSWITHTAKTMFMYSTSQGTHLLA